MHKRICGKPYLRAWQRVRLLMTALTTVVLLGIYLWMVFQEHRTEDGEDGLCIYAMEASAIDRLTFTGAEGPITLVRRGKAWIWEQEEEFPLNQNFTDTMVEKTAVLRAGAVVAEGKEQYGTYGLDQPSNVITVGAGDQEKVIYLGRVNSGSGDSYMAVEGSEKIYTVDASFSNIFSGSILSMAARESLPDFTQEDVIRFTVAEGEREIIFFREKEEDAHGQKPGWMVRENIHEGTQPVSKEPAAREPVPRESAARGPATKESAAGEPAARGPATKESAAKEPASKESPARDPLPEACPADEALVSRLLAQIPKIRYEELAAYHPDEKKLEEWGLQAPALRLQVVYRKDGGEELFSLGIGAEEDGCRYLYPQGGQGIYKSRDSYVMPFRNLTADAFLSLSVAQIRREELKGITVSMGEIHREYTLEAPKDGGATFRLDGEGITEKEFNSIYYPLYSLTAEKRVTDMGSQLTRSPALTIEYTRLPGCGEPVLVELIAYDQNYYAARVNGRAELLVNRQRVHALMELVD